MALKDLSSLLDLIGGSQPVSDMENQQGAEFYQIFLLIHLSRI